MLTAELGCDSHLVTPPCPVPCGYGPIMLDMETILSTNCTAV